MATPHNMEPLDADVASIYSLLSGYSLRVRAAESLLKYDTNLKSSQCVGY